MRDVGAIWADATLGLPMEDMTEWRREWCGTCTYGTPGDCPLTGAMDIDYTPAEITTTTIGTQCSQHRRRAEPDDTPLPALEMPGLGDGPGRPTPPGRPVPDTAGEIGSPSPEVEAHVLEPAPDVPDVPVFPDPGPRPA